MIRVREHLGDQALVFSAHVVPAGVPTSRVVFTMPFPGWPYRVGKPGPVVEVESPEAELELRERYPGQTFRIVRKYGRPR